MYKALIDTQSLKDRNVLKNYEVLGVYEEHWPGEDPENLEIAKVLVKEEEIKDLCKNLSEKWLLEEWFAVAWNETKTFIIFKNKIFALTGDTSLKEVIAYGKTQDIKEEYFINMKKAIKNF